jgi:hypothetical protein
VAGLLDGVNPCAFTTIVFLISVLAYLGKTRRQIAMVGVGFTAAVFVTYFALGLGLLGMTKAFSVSAGLSRWFTYAVAAIAFALAGWSLVDLIRYKLSGSVRKMTLGLPKSVKARIRATIRFGLTARRLLIGAALTGVVVSLLESLCTGQVYLPIVLVIQQVPELRVRAVALLLLYNIMFVAPLVAVMAMAYYGVRSERLAEFLRRRLGLLKLAMAALFAALGVVALLTV